MKACLIQNKSEVDVMCSNNVSRYLLSNHFREMYVFIFFIFLLGLLCKVLQVLENSNLTPGS